MGILDVIFWSKFDILAFCLIFFDVSWRKRCSRGSVRCSSFPEWVDAAINCEKIQFLSDEESHGRRIRLRSNSRSSHE